MKNFFQIIKYIVHPVLCPKICQLYSHSEDADNSSKISEAAPCKLFSPGLSTAYNKLSSIKIKSLLELQESEGE